MSVKCKACSKSIYPVDPQINLDGVKFHKACAKCGDCNCQITISNFTKNESNDSTVLLCKTHYFKRFHEGGSYLGGDKFRVKAARDVHGTPTIPSSTSMTSTTKEEDTTPAPKSFYSLPSKTKSVLKDTTETAEQAASATESSSVFSAVENLKTEESVNAHVPETSVYSVEQAEDAAPVYEKEVKTEESPRAAESSSSSAEQAEDAAPVYEKEVEAPSVEQLTIEPEAETSSVTATDEKGAASSD